VIDVRPAIGVPARLETSSKFDVDLGGAGGGRWQPGTVVTAADLAAIAAGTRRDAGRIVVVDTDPSRVEGVRLAVHLAGTSTDLDRLVRQADREQPGHCRRRHGPDVGEAREPAVELSSRHGADFLVVEAFNALKARALSGVTASTARTSRRATAPRWSTRISEASRSC
jgi:hypothetical protein